MGWDSNLAAMDAVVAGYFDEEAFSAVGMRKPPRDVNALWQQDPDRPSFDFFGSVETDTELGDIGRTGNASAKSLADRMTAKTCLTALCTGWAWQVRQGDQILRHQDGSRFTVATAPERDGTDRLVLWLNRSA